MMQLPFPPTVNHYYGYNWKTHQKYITRRGYGFRKRLALACLVADYKCWGDARLAMMVDAYPPRLIGDLDNLIKPLQDALEHAGIFNNDKQIDDLRIRRRHPVPGGKVEVQIWEL